MLGQQRVVADDEPFAGIVRAADFGQMALIEQGELNRLALHQTANLVVAQGRDPAQSRMTLQMVDLRLKEGRPQRGSERGAGEPRKPVASLDPLDYAF